MIEKVSRFGHHSLDLEDKQIFANSGVIARIEK
ncbi:hypothetical protein A2U01_0065205, partial [Trifolium medium]|nr:hypothetical protein [Trifolium medium]